MSAERKLICYQVGKPYDKVMGRDGAVLEASDNMYSISIGLSRMSDEERSAIESGQIIFFLSVIRDVIFLSVKLGDCLLFSMPFNVNLYSEYPLDDMHTTNRVIIIGIENETNVIQALRCIGFPRYFAKRLHMVIRKQRKKAISSYGVKLQQIYADFTDEDIIRQSICRCGFSEKNIKKGR